MRRAAPAQVKAAALALSCLGESKASRRLTIGHVMWENEVRRESEV